MRITSMMMGNTLSRSLSDLRGRLTGVQTDLATGRRLHRPSDHPAAMVDSLRVRTALDRLDRYERNIGDAMGWLGTADSALAHLTSILQRAGELAVQGANGTMSDTARVSLAQEVDKLLEGAVELANTAYGESFIFAGHRGDAPPFSLAAGVVAYNGNNGTVLREIAPSTTMQVNVTGSDLVAQTDLFTILQDLADRLRSGDQTGISQISVADINTAQDALVSLRAGIGARHQQVELMEQNSRDVRINLESSREVIEGVDMERTIIEYQQLDAAYSTALAVGARILPPSLLDFLR